MRSALELIGVRVRLCDKVEIIWYAVRQRRHVQRGHSRECAHARARREVHRRCLEQHVVVEVHYGENGEEPNADFKTQMERHEQSI